MTAPTEEVTPELLRALIESEQRCLLDEIAECYEEMALWQKKATELQRQLCSTSDRKINEWLGSLPRPAVAS